MTPQEINNYFDLLYNNSTNYEGSGFSAKEKSLLLTYAQEQILEKYYPIAESSEEYKRYLIPLKAKAEQPPSTIASAYPNASTFIFGTNVAYILAQYVEQEFNANSKCPPAGTVRRLDKVKSITSDYYGANIDNPFKKPYKDLVWSIKESEFYITIIGDETFTVTEYSALYYKKANPIIVPYAYTSSHGTISGISFSAYTVGLASEVHELHSEIVQEAVRIATAATKDQLGYQIQNMEKQLQ